jgi:hypothetical protein
MMHNLYTGVTLGVGFALGSLMFAVARVSLLNFIELCLVAYDQRKHND